MRYIKTQPPITHCMYLTTPDLKIIRQALQEYAGCILSSSSVAPVNQVTVKRIIGLIDASLTPFEVADPAKVKAEVEAFNALKAKKDEAS